VHRVERPLEVHARDGPDPALGDHPAQRRVPRAVSVVERRDHLAARLRDGGADAPHALGVDRERLLHDHVGAGVQGAHDVVGVREVGRRDDHPVEALVTDHPLEFAGRVPSGRRMPRRNHLPLVQVEPARVHVAPRGEFGDTRHVLGALDPARQCPDVHAGAASGADEPVPFTLRHRCSTRVEVRKRFLPGGR
jgi:hypothetical protein